MNKPQRNACSFKLKPIAASVVLACTALTSTIVNAGAGWGSGYYVTNPAVAQPKQTYFANSPSGAVVDLSGAVPGYTAVTPGTPTIDPVTQLPVTTDSGVALRKFVDTLPLIPGLNSVSGFLGSYPAGYKGVQATIPLATPSKWVGPNGLTTDDYYEIAAVEFSQKMHSDLPKATHLRGFVQIYPLNVTPGTGAVALTYPSVGKAAPAPVYFPGTTTQVYAYSQPSHLGPIIQANQGTAVRVKFYNFLPSGAAGNLFLPTDTTLTGAGTAPTASGGTFALTQNRVVPNLVGGDNPWVSAGSPYQWITPSAETAAITAGWGRGPSNVNVPDMPDPGPGATTLYFPNAHSARFTFIQDRTSGLFRLNAYAGLEAGYIEHDKVETGLVANNTLPTDVLPLILEDKTFVPQNVAQQDALWDTTHWGQPGDLWFPHVYETNQDPTTVDGTNPVGRWDYGAWFWPVFPVSGALPSGGYGSPSFVPEAYGDTPLVNGVAYPTITVDPKAYRVRLLNASNDRFFNLGWYVADTTVKAPQLDRNGNPIFDSVGNQLFFLNTEVAMVPAAADVTGAPLVPNGTNYDPSCLCQYPTMQQLQPTIAFSGPTRAWPVDSRPGGVPSNLAVGPDFIAYGNDGGLLPAPVDIPSQPIVYEQNRRSVTVTNVYGYGMLLGPNERADTVVDFSSYAGQTLILYNDAPAPFPFNDQRWDYFTNDQDLTANGGTYSTQPGYGPNTRTVMQVVVNATPTSAVTPFSAATLIANLPAAYGASQPVPVVPQQAYNASFGTNDADTYAHVATGSVAQPTLQFTSSSSGLSVSSANVVSSGGTLVVGTNNIVGNANPGSGNGYTAVPTVVFNDGGCLATGGTSATGTATVLNVAAPGAQPSYQVTGVTITNAGANGPYNCAPQILFGATDGSQPGVGAQAVAVMSKNGVQATQEILVQTKAEQELFDTLGRYNSTGGVEVPLTSDTTQTTIPLSYIDQPTEFICDSASTLVKGVVTPAGTAMSPQAANCYDPLTNKQMTTQIWKIVDNGFWSNSIHFAGFDVQVVNRVGWDGTVKAPASNEVGWKDTFRLNPLEDVVIAMRPKAAQVPFGQPWSNRSLDPTVANGAAGSNLGFTADPAVTNPNGAALLTATLNTSQNYGDEFVWGSVVAGHAENDLTRPLVFSRAESLPLATTAPVITPVGATNSVTWTDGVPLTAPNKLGNVSNEFKLAIQRVQVTNGVAGTAATLATLPANTQVYVDTAPPTYDYAYQVVATNNIGSATSPLSAVVAHLAAPTATAYAKGTLGGIRLPNGFTSAVNASTIEVQWSWAGAAVTGLTVQRAVVVNNVAGTPASVNATPGTFGTSHWVLDTGVTKGLTYQYTVTFKVGTTTYTATSKVVTAK